MGTLFIFKSFVIFKSVSVNRKFADIEAANHRLASALYFKKEEKQTSPLLSHKQDAPDSSGNPPQRHSLLDSEKCSVPTESILRTDISDDSNEAEIRVETLSDFGHGWKSHHKSNSSQTKERRQKKEGTQKLSLAKGKDYFQEAEFFQSEYHDDFEPISNLSDNPQAPPDSSSTSLCNQIENSSFSSELSPLSLDSFDFSDLTACSQDPKTFSEGQLPDLADLYSVCDSYSESCMDVEDYFDSSSSCQDEDLSDAGGEHKYRYSCQEEQSVTPDLLRSSRMLRQTVEEKQLNIQPCQSTAINSNLLSTSISCSSVTQLPLQESPFHNLNLSLFEGVAQSFFAPHHHREHRPIPTLPPEDDWLFTDILKDRQSETC